MVLTNANTFAGPTRAESYMLFINEGWITAETAAHGKVCGQSGRSARRSVVPGRRGGYTNSAPPMLKQDLSGNNLTPPMP